MSKNRQGHTKSGGNQEWGRKARKEEDRLRGTNNTARREAINTAVEQMECPYCKGDFVDAGGPGSDCGFCDKGVHEKWT